MSGTISACSEKDCGFDPLPSPWLCSLVCRTLVIVKTPKVTQSTWRPETLCIRIMNGHTTKEAHILKNNYLDNQVSLRRLFNFAKPIAVSQS